jgi:hypothetical protein
VAFFKTVIGEKLRLRKKGNASHTSRLFGDRKNRETERAKVTVEKKEAFL